MTAAVFETAPIVHSGTSPSDGNYSIRGTGRQPWEGLLSGVSFAGAFQGAQQQGEDKTAERDNGHDAVEGG